MMNDSDNTVTVERPPDQSSKKESRPPSSDSGSNPPSDSKATKITFTIVKKDDDNKGNRSNSDEAKAGAKTASSKGTGTTTKATDQKKPSTGEKKAESKQNGHTAPRKPGRPTNKPNDKDGKDKSGTKTGTQDKTTSKAKAKDVKKARETGKEEGKKGNSGKGKMEKKSSSGGEGNSSDSNDSESDDDRPLSALMTKSHSASKDQAQASRKGVRQFTDVSLLPSLVRVPGAPLHTSPEVPYICHFVWLCQAVLNFRPITPRELEPALKDPSESLMFRELVTKLLLCRSSDRAYIPQGEAFDWDTLSQLLTLFFARAEDLGREIDEDEDEDEDNSEEEGDESDDSDEGGSSRPGMKRKRPSRSDGRDKGNVKEEEKKKKSGRGRGRPRKKQRPEKNGTDEDEEEEEEEEESSSEESESDEMSEDERPGKKYNRTSNNKSSNSNQVDKKTTSEDGFAQLDSDMLADDDEGAQVDVRMLFETWEGENPLKEKTFEELELRDRARILYALCEYRTHCQDFRAHLSTLEPSAMRVEPLGRDARGLNYYYFAQDDYRVYVQGDPVYHDKFASSSSSLSITSATPGEAHPTQDATSTSLSSPISSSTKSTYSGVDSQLTLPSITNSSSSSSSSAVSTPSPPSSPSSSFSSTLSMNDLDASSNPAPSPSPLPFIDPTSSCSSSSASSSSSSSSSSSFSSSSSSSSASSTSSFSSLAQSSSHQSSSVTNETPEPKIHLSIRDFGQLYADEDPYAITETGKPTTPTFTAQIITGPALPPLAPVVFPPNASAAAMKKFIANIRTNTTPSTNAPSSSSSATSSSSSSVPTAITSTSSDSIASSVDSCLLDDKLIASRSDFGLACDSQDDMKALILRLKGSKEPADQQVAVELFHILDELCDGRLNYQTMQLMTDEELAELTGEDPRKIKKSQGKGNKDKHKIDGIEMVERRSSERVRRLEAEKSEAERLQSIIEAQRAFERKIQRERNIQKWGDGLIEHLTEELKKSSYYM